MTQTQIPEQMTAVVLDSYSGAEALQVEQRPVPKPGKDEVLVKVAASPIKPGQCTFMNECQSADYRQKLRNEEERKNIGQSRVPLNMMIVF